MDYCILILSIYGNPEKKIKKTLRNEVKKIEYTTPDDVAERYEKILEEFAQESLKICKNKKEDHSGKAKWITRRVLRNKKLSNS